MLLHIKLGVGCFEDSPVTCNIVWDVCHRIHEVALSLYLSDAPANLKPVIVRGDGKCLFRQVSIGLSGNESKHRELRLKYCRRAAKQRVNLRRISSLFQKLYKRIQLLILSSMLDKDATHLFLTSLGDGDTVETALGKALPLLPFFGKRQRCEIRMASFPAAVTTASTDQQWQFRFWVLQMHRRSLVALKHWRTSILTQFLEEIGPISWTKLQFM